MIVILHGLADEYPEVHLLRAKFFIGMVAKYRTMNMVSFIK